MPARLYDWDAWLAKDRFVLRRGKDYSCPTSSIIQQLRQAASNRKVQLSVDDRGTEVAVQVVGRKEAASC